MFRYKDSKAVAESCAGIGLDVVGQHDKAGVAVEGAWSFESEPLSVQETGEVFQVSDRPLREEEAISADRI